jgi:hypothetical protein
MYSHVEEGDGPGMKRTAILILAIATLVLVGFPSAHVFADSSNSIPAKSGPGVVATMPGGSLAGGGPVGNGDGSNQGDADGLSGLKGRPPVVSTTVGSPVSRVAVYLENWWKFMLWIR